MAEIQRITELTTKFRLGTITALEQAELDSHINACLENRRAFEERLGEKWTLEGLSIFAEAAEIEEAQMSRMNFMGGEEPVRKAHIGDRLKTKWILPASIAASVLLLATGTVFFLTSRRQSARSLNHFNQISKDIHPGGAKARLTLADGSVVTLDSLQNGTISSQGSSQVKKVINGQLAYIPVGKTAEVVSYNTVSVPKGGQYQVILPDGTKVWLNASSSIHFPTSFAGKDRSVTITGEAYFEVMKNARMPFHVVTGGTDIEVLGTEFNVNAYTNENAQQITLLEGSVRVIPDFGHEASPDGSGSFTDAGPHVLGVVLKPGEQAHLANAPVVGVNSKNGNTSTNEYVKVLVKKVSTADIVAWTKNFFSFDHADLQAVMRQLSRWYDIEVKYPDGPIQDCYFDGNIDRELPLSKVLEILQSRKIHFKIEQGNVLLVTP